VYTAVPADLKRATLLPIIRERVEPDSLVITDGLNVYDTLDAEGFEHERVSHGDALVEYGPNGRAAHINGIENFWRQAKRHLRKYNGIPKGHFELFLKECEWRFNYGTPRELLRTLRSWTVI
jgi:transposase